MCNKQPITMRYLIYCKSLKQKYSFRSLRSRSLRSLRVSGGKEYIYNIILKLFNIIL